MISHGHGRGPDPDKLPEWFGLFVAAALVASFVFWVWIVVF